MKKVLISIFLLSCIFTCDLFIEAKELDYSDASLEVLENIIYLDNGDYIIKTIKEVNSNSSLQTRSIYTKTGELEVNHYNASDKLLWTYTLVGIYQINEGISCSCVSSSYSTEIFKSTWSFSDGDSSYANNYARGLGVFKCKILFVTAQTVDIDVTLYCDVYGNLS